MVVSQSLGILTFEGNDDIHMIAWSVKPRQAYLSKDGIKKIKSALTNDIFKQEMLHTYVMYVQMLPGYSFSSFMASSISTLSSTTAADVGTLDDQFCH